MPNRQPGRLILRFSGADHFIDIIGNDIDADHAAPIRAADLAAPLRQAKRPVPGFAAG